MQRIQFKFMLDPTGPVLAQEWLEVITLRRRGALERPLIVVLQMVNVCLVRDGFDGGASLYCTL